MKTVHQVRRKLAPAIQWAPARDSHYIVASLRPSAAEIDPLYVSQAAIASCDAHVSGTQAVPFGLFVGAACICPRTKIQYLLLDEALPARIELTPDEPDAQLSAELRALTAIAESRDKLVLGWYLGGMDEDLRLDPELERLHRSLFPDPWQFALVRSHDREGEHGAFLRLDAIADHFYPIPFGELPDAGARGEADGLPSVVSWTTYRTEQRISPIRANVQKSVPPLATETPKQVEAPLRRWIGSFRSALDATTTSARPSVSIRAPAAVSGPPKQVQSVSYTKPTTIPYTPPAPRPLVPAEPEKPSEEQVAFPALPELDGASPLRLPMFARRRLPHVVLAVLMLLEALWLLRILR